MAIYAVHETFLVLDTLGADFSRPLGIDIFTEFAIAILNADPANFLAFLVQGEIPNLGSDMPVDIPCRFKLSAPDPQHPGVNVLGVHFVCLVGGVDTNEVAGKPLRPMALRTGLAGRAEVFYRGWNGAVVGTEDCAEDKRYAA